MTRRLLLLSNSTCHGLGFLEHCESAVVLFLSKTAVKKITFIPYALKDQDTYAETVAKAFKKFDITVESNHQAVNAIDQIDKSEAIFIGGGNSFLLLKTLYDKKLIEPIRKRVLEDGIPYIGSSAGTNVSTVSISTTNDMPIVYPPSFLALNLVPFNINPHYIEPDVNDKHMGETREKRIQQYHEIAGTPPVLGLREGTWLEVEGIAITLHGCAAAKLFQREKEPREIQPGSAVTILQ